MKRPRQGFHEDFGREQHPEPGSSRNFAITMAIILVIAGLYFLITSRSAIGVALLSLAGAFLLLELVWPRALATLNRLWFRFGMLLGGVVSPLVMGIIFFAVVTPIGLIRRLGGADSLHLKPDPELESWWQRRDPPGPDPKHLPRQF